MTRYEKMLVAVVIVSAVALWLLSSSPAKAHGPHHSPIKPAYDCFRDVNRIDTEGDVVVTRDDNLGVRVVWKCICERVGGITHCWWHKMGTYKILAPAVKKMRALTGPNHGREVLRYIRVSWFAKHGGSGCFIHRGKRYAIVVRRAG